jgi:hypothetical protein
MHPQTNTVGDGFGTYLDPEEGLGEDKYDDEENTTPDGTKTETVDDYLEAIRASRLQKLQSAGAGTVANELVAAPAVEEDLEDDDTRESDKAAPATEQSTSPGDSRSAGDGSAGAGVPPPRPKQKAQYKPYTLCFEKCRGKIPQVCAQC